MVGAVWGGECGAGDGTGQKTIGSENAVRPPDDGRKDARKMLRNY